MKLPKIALTLSIISLMMTLSRNTVIPDMIFDLIDGMSVTSREETQVFSGYVRTNSGALLNITTRGEKIKKDSHVKIHDLKNKVTYSCNGEQLAEIIKNN